MAIKSIESGDTFIFLSSEEIFTYNCLINYINAEEAVILKDLIGKISYDSFEILLLILREPVGFVRWVKYRNREKEFGLKAIRFKLMQVFGVLKARRICFEIEEVLKILFK